MPIESVEDLRTRLSIATDVEFSTIPPYLYALYSIKDQSSTSARLIASIVVEEMLHVCLTTNLLLALGGEPSFARRVAPAYPALLAHHRPDLQLELRACTMELVRDTFLKVERPAPADAEPEDDQYETLGQFYGSVMSALIVLARDTDLFTNPQRERQMSNPAFYGPVHYDAADSGGLMLIDDVASATAALEIVIHQGEGVGHERWADPEHVELTHFSKLDLIASGAVDIGPVWPVLDNPRTAQFPEELRDVSHLFNACYRLTLLTMHRLFSGEEDQSGDIGVLYTLMTGALAPIACYLASKDVGTGRHAGPTFEHHAFAHDPWHEAATLAARVARAHPELADVAERLGRR